MTNWVQVRDADDEDIALWCNENGITFTQRYSIINPNTFEREFKWFIPDEKDLLIFKLKWS